MRNFTMFFPPGALAAIDTTNKAKGNRAFAGAASA